MCKLIIGMLVIVSMSGCAHVGNFMTGFSNGMKQQQPLEVELQPVHCTTSYISGQAFTNCY